MKKYLVKINNSSRKYLLKLTEKQQDLILQKLNILETWNFELLDIKELEPKKFNKYRLRIWKYRIIFEKNKNKLYILILKISSRWDIYK